MKATRSLLLAALLVAPLLADEPVTTQRVLDLFGAGEPLNLQLAFDQDDTTHDLNINTTSANAGTWSADGTSTASFSTKPFVHDGVEHCFRIRVRDGLLEAVELLAFTPGPDGDRSRGAWNVVAPEVFLFVPSDPPRRTTETDEEGRVSLSAWGTCNLGPGSKERGRALLVVRSGHVEGAGEARY